MAETNNEQTIVDDLIRVIRAASDPDSVTPEMVGRVLSHLNISGKSLSAAGVQLGNDIKDLQDTDKNHDTELKKVAADIKGINESKGQANGLATLDSHGIVNESQLLHPAIYFSGMLDPDSVEDLRVGGTLDIRPWEERWHGETAQMVYNTRDNCLWLHDPAGAATNLAEYLRTWKQCWLEGERKSAVLTIPYSNRLYIDVTTGKGYYWGDGHLVSLTQSLERAIAGDREALAELRVWIHNVDEFTNELKAGLDRHAEHLQEHDEHLSDSDAIIRMLGYRLRESERERERLESELRTLGATCTDSESGLWSGRAIWHDDEIWRDEAWSADAAVAELDSRLTAAIEDVKLRELIAQWKDATKIYTGPNSQTTSLGDYDLKTELFLYAGKLTLTESEVRAMFADRFMGPYNDCKNSYSNKWWLPAILPLYVQNGSSLNDTFSLCRRAKIIVLDGYYDTLAVSAMGFTFNNCLQLRFIVGKPIDVSLIKAFGSGTFLACTALEEVWMKGLKASISFSASPLLKRECLEYLVKNALNDTTITVTVHPDVFAKLTGDTTNVAVSALTEEERKEWTDLLQLALDKNITFATN